MKVIDGIAFADADEPVLTVVSVQALDDHVLRVRFSDGEERELDMAPFLKTPAFRPLADESAFRAVSLEYGAPSWCHGTIDLAPSYIYEHGHSLTSA
jgi:hypothetical protein